MNKLLNVSSSPHVRSSVTTQNLMLDVVIAIVICTVVTLLCMTLLHAITARLKVEQVFKFFWTVVSGLALVSLLLVWFVD